MGHDEHDLSLRVANDAQELGDRWCLAPPSSDGPGSGPRRSMAPWKWTQTRDQPSRQGNKRWGSGETPIRTPASRQCVPMQARRDRTPECRERDDARGPWPLARSCRGSRRRWRRTHPGVLEVGQQHVRSGLHEPLDLRAAAFGRAQIAVGRDPARWPPHFARRETSFHTPPSTALISWRGLVERRELAKTTTLAKSSSMCAASTAIMP